MLGSFSETFELFMYAIIKSIIVCSDLGLGIYEVLAAIVYG